MLSSELVRKASLVLFSWAWQNKGNSMGTLGFWTGSGLNVVGFKPGYFMCVGMTWFREAVRRICELNSLCVVVGNLDRLPLDGRDLVEVRGVNLEFRKALKSVPLA